MEQEAFSDETRSVRTGEGSILGAEGVGSVAGLFAAAVLAFVTKGEDFECLGFGGSFFAFYFFSVLEVFEHG